MSLSRVLVELLRRGSKAVNACDPIMDIDLSKFDLSKVAVWLLSLYLGGTGALMHVSPSTAVRISGAEFDACWPYVTSTVDMILDASKQSTPRERGFWDRWFHERFLGDSREDDQ